MIIRECGVWLEGNQPSKKQELALGSDFMVTKNRNSIALDSMWTLRGATIRGNTVHTGKRKPFPTVISCTNLIAHYSAVGDQQEWRPSPYCDDVMVGLLPRLAWANTIYSEKKKRPWPLYKSIKKGGSTALSANWITHACGCGSRHHRHTFLLSCLHASLFL